MKEISIAIDGPASAGKSTVAKMVAKKLGYIYVDTGAMYRALTYSAIVNHVNISNEEELVELLSRIEISFKYSEEEQLVYIGSENVSQEIRQSDVTNQVSEVSAHRRVREELVKRQQDMSNKGGVVMDGRDIGTVVLPKAEVKIFLVASVEERAERRYKENIQKGIETDFETLKREIENRDYKDSHRKESPLVQAKDAILIDTTGMNVQQVTGEIFSIMGNPPFDEKKR